MTDDRHIIGSDATLTEALRALNALSGSVMTLIAVGPDGRPEGTLTDGDVRRGLLGGLDLGAPVAAAMRRDFSYLTLPVEPLAIRRARSRGIKLIPVLDGERRIADILDLSRRTTVLPIRAVLMAGGRGERLRPLTDTMPKPLLPVGGKPIIDRNVEALRRCGVDDITVTTRYMAEQIEAHFAGSDAVRCVRESLPLGTIGACSLLPPASGATLVMNSDLLTTMDFEEFYLHHVAARNKITIATIPHTVSIPYAILSVEGDRVAGIEEKPSYTHYANAGIYLIEDSLLGTIAHGERLDAPDFIERNIAAGERVGYFPISGTWLDIGTPADYRQANELMRLSGGLVND